MVFTSDELELIAECIDSKINDISILRFCGGDVGDSVRSLLSDLIDLDDKIYFFITAGDVEANSQDPAAALPKRTASDLDQREAGDEVSLDQHIQLYKEVF